MDRSLQKNICQLSGQGCFIEEVSEAALSQHLPYGLRYASRHWISHARHGGVSLSDNGIVHEFLHWLEIISLIRKVPEVITSIMQLESLIQVRTISSKIKLYTDAEDRQRKLQSSML